MAELTDAQRDFIDLARVARLATVDSDGAPHNVPVCPLLDDGLVYVASGINRKVRNLRGEPRVALVFDDYVELWDALKFVLVEGSASEVEAGPRYAELKERFYTKYPQYPTMGGGIDQADTAILEITIDRIVSDGV
ncbi:MAG: pyridoxamine 5'-phosphate oxidase family protein [Actinomycetota bacterium]